MSDSVLQWREAIREHRVALRKYCRKIGGPDADDLFQETIVCLRRRLKFIEGDNPLAFMCGVAKNIQRDKVKRAAKTPERLTEIDSRVEASNSSPSSRIQRTIDAKKISRQMSLSRRDREILNLYADDLTVVEIAGKLGITADAAYQRLRRARKRARKEYERLTQDGTPKR